MDKENGFIGWTVSIGYADVLIRRGIPYTVETVAGIGTASAPCHHYTYALEGVPRHAYGLSYDGYTTDDPHEDIFVFTRPVLSLAVLEQLIREARKLPPRQ